MDSKKLSELRRLAAEMRLQIVRMMGSGKPHHFGGSLSATDIVTALYFYKMRYDPQKPDWPYRDRFLMSKGHSVPAQYAALGMAGFFPIEELQTLKKLESRLQGHPAMRYTPGLEGCTGSLGQGLSYSNGMALSARLQGLGSHVYCLLGDGELQEGQVWEAAMTAPKHCLTNLTAIIDCNGLKAMNETHCGKPLQPLISKWASFGWEVREINGHDMSEVCEALDWATGLKDAPGAIIALTVKGKGISFMEDKPGFHNAALTEEQYDQAVAELENNLKRLEVD